MYSARREGRELGQLREAACLMYGARRGEERCTSVWGTGATQGALTSPHPSLRPPTGADRPLAALLGKTTARGRSAPPPAPRCPVSCATSPPPAQLAFGFGGRLRSRLRFFAKDGHDQFSCPLRYGAYGAPRRARAGVRIYVHVADLVSSQQSISVYREQPASTRVGAAGCCVTATCIRDLLRGGPFRV
jgi:hypothetical protein